jgi:hypothetical protein
MAQNNFKVKLRSQLSRDLVVFDVVPDVSETRSVEYKSMNPVHSPGTIYAYSHTPSRVFAINNARLISRTPLEASKNMIKLQRLRSWTLPYFGSASNGRLGLPPDVLSLYAFAAEPIRTVAKTTISNPDRPDIGESTNTSTSTSRGSQFNLHNIPVVLNNLQITYPSDVDYIPTAAFREETLQGDFIEIPAGEPFPTIMSVDLNLFETQSPSDFNRFNLDDYRRGRLKGF